MKNKKAVLIIGGIILAGIIVSLCINKKNAGSQNVDIPVFSQEQVESLGSYVLDKPEKHVSSPDIEEQEELDLYKDDNSTYYRNPSGHFRFDIPEGFHLKKSGNIYYLRNDDNSIQMALVVTSNNCTNSDEVFSSRMSYMTRMTGYFGGQEHTLFNLDTSPRPEKTVGDFTVQSEASEAWFRNDNDIQNFKSPAYTYYTILSNTETTESDGDETEAVTEGKGILLTCFSEKDKSEVYKVMDQVLESIREYEPTAEDLNPSYELKTYQSSGKDAVELAYPKDWNLSMNSDGMVIITSTDDDSSPYANMIIEFLADENHRIVEDYAQFSGAYEYKLLLPYFIQPVGDSAFNYRTAVTKTDLHKKIGEKECIYFEVEDQIIPVSTSVRNSMRCDSYDVTSIRYTFKTNGVDCMLNFLVPKGSSTDLVEKLLAASKIN